MKNDSFGIEIQNLKIEKFSEENFEKEIESFWGTYRLNTSEKFVQTIQ
ncbi:hypothetical protein KAI58_03350 [Candidatus Gracilibacteria bacterium]|nr:hypothetical protein [Candidatus Gracilibacteria bacterium]